VRCTCEEGFEKHFTPVDRRRKLAVFGEEMFCENAKSCLIEKIAEEEGGFAGPRGSFYECYDMSTDNFYPITSYNTENDNSNLDIQPEVYCTEYTVTCEPKFGNISLYVNFSDSAFCI
jgi:hypothetical protein